MKIEKVIKVVVVIAIIAMAILAHDSNEQKTMDMYEAEKTRICEEWEGVEEVTFQKENGGAAYHIALEDGTSVTRYYTYVEGIYGSPDFLLYSGSEYTEV